jgi:hypothetical protein
VILFFFFLSLSSKCPADPHVIVNAPSVEGGSIRITLDLYWSEERGCPFREGGMAHKIDCRSPARLLPKKEG